MDTNCLFADAFVDMGLQDQGIMKGSREKIADLVRGLFTFCTLSV